MEIKLEQMVETLQHIRRQHGDEDFQRALRGLFRDLLCKDGGEQYIERLLEALGRPAGVDMAGLKAEARARQPEASQAPGGAAAGPAQIVEAAIRQAVPNCKTQAHFDLILNAWQALQVYVNAAYGFDRETAGKARAGLDRLLDLAPQLAATHEKLEDHPEATTNRNFVEPAKEMTEFETMYQLLLELNAITSKPELDAWYERSKPLMNRIVTQKLRNEVFDSVRAKKRALLAS